MLNVPQRVLSDVRDGNTYRIKKLADGKCWMTENLKLGTVTNTTVLTSADSDITAASYTLTRKSGTDAITSGGAYDTGIADYGAYYNWRTATAGTSIMAGETTVSICPKGWKMPSSGVVSGSDFYDLFILYNTIDLVKNSVAGPQFVLSGVRIQYGDERDWMTIEQNETSNLWSKTIQNLETSRYVGNPFITNIDLRPAIYATGYSLGQLVAGLPIRCLAK